MAECSSEFKRIAFVGYNFITRFERYCHRHNIKTSDLNHQLACSAPRGHSSACLSFVRRNVVPELRAEKLILQIGGNDLNSTTCEPVQLARNILQIARDVVNQNSVLQVVTCQLCNCFRPSPFSGRSSVTVRQ